MARNKVFICYSREDDSWRKALRVNLKPFEGGDGSLDVWDDTEIEAGELWRERITDALAEAKVGVLLVSPEFLASEFIARDEVPALLESAVTRGTRLLCVYVRPSLARLRKYDYRDPKTGERCTRLLTDFQGLNEPDKPLSLLPERERERALVRLGETILAIAGGREVPVPAVLNGPRPVFDARPYLEKLRNDTRLLELRGIGAKVAERVELERVYTRLRVVGPMRVGEEGRHEMRGAKDAVALGDETRMRDAELRDLLRDYSNLVLVGDPGAGKTTFLRFVALNLARALLGEDRNACLERIGLGGDPPFPVFVRLGSFGQFLNAQARADLPDDAAEHFYRHLDYLGRGVDAALPETFLRERVRAGGCLLLLDGLDEVPSEELRERVGAIVDQVVGAGKPRGNRHVVTCRTRAYRGKAQLGEDFKRGTLVDFGRDEIDAFVTQWSRALFRVPPGAESGAEVQQADEHRRELLGAIRAHPHVQPLTTNPLLLTILAVVHWNKKKLPEQRADLYDAALDYLLETREKQSPQPATLRKDCLKAIALRQFEDPQGVRKTLGRREAAQAVARFFKSNLPKAEAFVEDEELYSGVLVSRIEGEVEFWHPTFGEYLAALGLALEPDYWERVRPHVFDESWSEVVLLLAGCRRRQGLGLASEFIGRILRLDETAGGSARWVGLVGTLRRLFWRPRDTLAVRARAVALVGRIVRDILPAGGDPEEGTGYAEARQQVLASFERGSKVAESVRIEVGEALGRAGDPRIHDDDHANRVPIRGGTFWMGAQKADRKKPGYDPQCYDDEAPVRRVTLTDFWIDRYPVTVQQYRRFVEAGAEGYLDVRFWRPEGWSWREGARREQPGEWEQQLQYLNRAVTYVSWYEADAYCRWLAERSGRDVRLASEAQWEYAARGPSGRKYPWGNEPPSERHANFGMRAGHPTPVGIYPLGATPDGVQDLSGNVWEWCADWWVNAYAAEDQTDPPGPAGGTSRLLRGGAFSRNAGGCRAAARNCGVPEFDGYDVGFRCVELGGRTAMIDLVP